MNLLYSQNPIILKILKKWSQIKKQFFIKFHEQANISQSCCSNWLSFAPDHFYMIVKNFGFQTFWKFANSWQFDVRKSWKVPFYTFKRAGLIQFKIFKFQKSLCVFHRICELFFFWLWTYYRLHFVVSWCRFCKFVFLKHLSFHVIQISIYGVSLSIVIYHFRRRIKIWSNAWRIMWHLSYQSKSSRRDYQKIHWETV